MKKAVRRSFVCVVTLALVAVAFAHAGVSEEGMDFWNVPKYQSRLDEEAQRERDIEATSNAIQRRILLKTELINDWIEEKRTFSEVVDEFTILNEQYPKQINIIRIAYPGNTFRECQARNVHEFCRATARAKKGQTKQLHARVDADLKAFLESEQVAMHPAQ